MIQPKPQSVAPGKCVKRKLVESCTHCVRTGQLKDSYVGYTLHEILSPLKPVTIHQIGLVIIYSDLFLHLFLTSVPPVQPVHDCVDHHVHHVGAGGRLPAVQHVSEGVSEEVSKEVSEDVNEGLSKRVSEEASERVIEGTNE